MSNEALVNHFEGHDGSTGPITIVAKKAADLPQLNFLAWDLDGSSFQPGFDLFRHIGAVLSEADIRQTGERNYHVVQYFDPPLTDHKKAKCIWRKVQTLLLGDPSSSYLMKPRVVGSVKEKKEGTFTVALVAQGRRVAPEDLSNRLRTDSREGLYRVLLTQTLLTPSSREPLWDGESQNGICPLHGSGNSPRQATYEPEQLLVSCWGDCKEDGQDGPKRFDLADIVEARVLTPDAFAKWEDGQS